MNITKDYRKHLDERNENIRKRFTDIFNNASEHIGYREVVERIASEFNITYELCKYIVRSVPYVHVICKEPGCGVRFIVDKKELKKNNVRVCMKYCAVHSKRNKEKTMERKRDKHVFNFESYSRLISSYNS